MKRLTPIQAIRKNCLECSNHSVYEVTNCEIKECPLYQFRLGKNPNRKGIGNSNPVFSFGKPNNNLSSTNRV